MVEALSAEREIAGFLEAEEDYAAPFRIFAANAVELARIYLRDHVHDDDDTFATITRRFAVGIAAKNNSGPYANDTDEVPVYVGPGADAHTEDLRSVFRRYNLLTPAVPENPKEGGELELLSQLYAQHLHELTLIAKGKRPYHEETLVKQVRRMNAVFRLSFRQPSKRQMTNAERDLVVGLVQDSIENMRRGVKTGAYPLSALQSTLEQFEDWKRNQQGHEEL